MKVKDLIKQLKQFNDNDIVCVEVFDMTAYEDLYEFYIDCVAMNKTKNEIRLSITKNK